MKTLICNQPGTFEYRQTSFPVLEKDHAIINLRRVGVCGTDLHAFDGTQPYFTYPRVLGHELAGELVKIDGNPNFEAGELVSVLPYLNCGRCIACRSGRPNCCVSMQVLGVHVDGGMAEYISVPTKTLVKGSGLGLDELALIEPLAIGAHSVRRAGILPGEFVLVVGAGPIGLAAMEFSRLAGGTVIALDVNEQRLRFCKDRLAIDYVLNGRATDVGEQLMEITGGDMPTVVMDATGNLDAINNSFRYMANGARYVLIGLQKGNIGFSHPEFHKREGTLMSSRNATRQDFDYVISSIQRGLVDPKIYITHRLPFDNVKDEFAKFLNPSAEVVKVMIEIAESPVTAL